jgi:hypothetical protein
MILSLSLSVIYVALVQFFPKLMNQLSIVLGSLVILALSICVFTYYPDSHGRIPIAVVLIIIFGSVLLSSFRNRRAIAMNGVFMSAAAKMLKETKKLTFLYIPLFISFLTGFILLVIY